MADLSEEEKIVIGVCSAIAGLIIIGIIIFICCVLYRRQRRRHYRHRKDRYIKERIIDDGRFDHDRFYGGEFREIKKIPPPYDPIPEPLPPPLPLPPPPPPEPRSRWEMYDYKDPLYLPVHKTYAREARREVEYNNPPIVIPMREPEYIVSAPAEPETLYLKYRDDQALLPATSYYRRPETRYLRRTRSMTDVRPRSKYVGEWGHTIFQPWEMPFNDRAARAGRDPFLWQD